MDTQLWLRILHILFGVFWVGTDVFLTFVLLPRLKALGPEIERPVMSKLMRVLPPVIMISSIITLVSGVLLIGETRGWSVLFTTGWGWAIFIGFVLTGLAMIVGFGAVPPLTMRYEKLYRTIEGRSPTPDESLKLESLTRSIKALANTNSVMLLIVVVTMAIARFV